MTPQEWYTAAELAGTPKLPSTESGVIRRAKREAWPFRERNGQGGGREYHLDVLPKEAREALLDAAIASLPANVCNLPEKVEAVTKELAVQVLPSSSELKGWQRRTMEARLALLQLIEQLEPLHGTTKAVEKVVSLAQAGQLPPHLQSLVPVANARSGGELGKQTLSRRTLFRWRDQRTVGITALAPREAARAQMPPWGALLLKAWGKPQKPALSEVVRALNAEGVDINYSQARRFLEKVGEVQKNKGRMGPKEIKTIKGFRRRDTSELIPGDIYAADGHTFDAEVAHPHHGGPFRPEVTLIIDVATRMPVGWSVALAESTLATLDALRHACDKRGIPAIFYTDNGSGYCNEVMTAPGTGLLARLGITHKTSIPYNSQARGVIERAHRTILVSAAKNLPTYVGAPMDQDARKVAFKQTRKDRTLLLEWADFVRLIEAAIAEYAERPHKGLPQLRDPVTGSKRHYSPAEYWMSFIEQGWVPVPTEGVDDTYYPQVLRTVDRCEVRFSGNVYFSRELQEWHGCDVRVGYDVHDPAKVWIRDEHERLLCIAELGANKSGFFPQSVVEQAAEKRAQGRAQRLERKLAEVELERNGGRRPIEIDAAEVQAARKRLEIEMTAPAPTKVQIPVDGKGKWKLWKELERSGEVPEELASFYRSFPKTKAWAAFNDVERELGGDRVSRTGT